MLAATDRSTPRGRRDYAILLLLARLGLRAGEIVSLELDDIRWRTAEIVVRGKGRMVDQLPLLARYWRSLGRLPTRGSWRQLITTDLLTNLGAAYRSDRAGGGWAHCAPSARPSRDSPLRARCCPSVPPRLSDQNDSPWRLSTGDCGSTPASLSNDHIRIYTQVAFEALRTVAQPWPATGGAR